MDDHGQQAGGDDSKEKGEVHPSKPGDANCGRVVH
jgi:hypothetical protein